MATTLLEPQWLTNGSFKANQLSKIIVTERQQDELDEEQEFKREYDADGSCLHRKTKSPISPAPGQTIGNGATLEELISPKASLTPNSCLNYGHHPAHEPSRRPLHVLIAGAGPSGIAMAIELMKLSNVTFEIFEKNHDVGGTWLENRYPGAACDIASHAYQYTFEQNTDWSHQ